MLTVLGGLAEFERHLILSRTAEGRTRAQANGVRFGRKPALTPYQRAEALRRREAGETLTEIAKSMNVSHMTIARLGNDARFAVRVLAKQIVRKTIKEQLRRQGVKLSYVSARDNQHASQSMVGGAS
jgi:hypothetical protein